MPSVLEAKDTKSFPCALEWLAPQARNGCQEFTDCQVEERQLLWHIPDLCPYGWTVL